MANDKYLSTGEFDRFASCENIEMLYHMCPAHLRNIDWYEEARIDIAIAANKVGIDFDTMAAIVAVISPMKYWTQNITDAIALVEHWQERDLSVSVPGVGGIIRNNAKAQNIFLGDDPTDVLSGPKVKAFYRNLIGDTDTVTVDSHAAWIALGTNEQGSVKFSPANYARLSQMYRIVARKLGITASELQAVTWTARKWFLENDKGNALAFPNVEYIGA